MTTIGPSASALSTYHVPTITSYKNMGPMTTPMSFPAKCKDNLYDMQTNGIGVSWTYYTQGCGLSECCPSSNAYTAPYQWYTEYYSPAVCPSDYQTCGAPTGITSQPQETVAMCCPSGYQCSAFLPNASSSSAVPLTVPAYNWFCQNTQINVSTSAIQLDNMFDQFTQSTVSPINQNYYAAYPLQIRWKEGDFDGVKTTTDVASGTSTSSPAPAQSLGSGRPTTTSVVGTQKQGASGLSTGAIAAIASVAGVLLLSALGGLVWWLSRRSRAQHSKEIEAKGEDAADISEQDMANVGGRKYNELEGREAQRDAELDGSERLEMEANQRVELGEGNQGSMPELG